MFNCFRWTDIFVGEQQQPDEVRTNLRVHCRIAQGEETVGGTLGGIVTSDHFYFALAFVALGGRSLFNEP